ncbi:MAG: orotate phosphoribosyltransferase [Bacteroidota bacterium]|nr:orotate phosphoribosyltransferase [Bacteroidota bacterium]
MANIKIQSAVAGEVSSMLLKIGAIKLNANYPFTWSSGIKSPIYCDNRLALSYPQVRTRVKKELVRLIQQFFPEAQGIGGVATAGIPQGALIADALELPFIYVRSSPKNHGMANLIEGKVTPSSKIVVVEDLVSTGGSSLKAVDAIRDSGMEVLGMIAIFNYGFEVAEKNFLEADVNLFCLSDYDHLLKEAIKGNYIKQNELDNLKSWREAPEVWNRV